MSYRISRELSVERDVRSNDGKTFVTDVFNEFNSILDKQETKERRTKEFMLLSNEIEDLGSEGSSTASQNPV